jgi:hypothetical protein
LTHLLLVYLTIEQDSFLPFSVLFQSAIYQQLIRAVYQQFYQQFSSGLVAIYHFISYLSAVFTLPRMKLLGVRLRADKPLLNRC